MKIYQNIPAVLIADTVVVLTELHILVVRTVGAHLCFRHFLILLISCSLLIWGIINPNSHNNTHLLTPINYLLSVFWKD